MASPTIRIGAFVRTCAAVLCVALASAACGTTGGTGEQGPRGPSSDVEPEAEDPRDAPVTLRVINEAEYPAEIDAFMGSARTSLGDVSSLDSVNFDLSRRAAIQTGRRVQFRADLTISRLVLFSEPIFPMSGSLIRWIIHPTGRQPPTSLYVYRTGR